MEVIASRSDRVKEKAMIKISARKSTRQFQICRPLAA
jgi:hypothetical protein